MVSARIKRRNKQGFLGLSKHNPNPKEVNIPINNEFVNHKYEDKLANYYQKNLIDYAKNHHFKHPGSKPISKLKRYI